MESKDIKEVGKLIEKEYPVIKQIQTEVAKVIVGQSEIIEKFIMLYLKIGVNFWYDYFMQNNNPQLLKKKDDIKWQV